jgi:hypothetical protein
VISCRARRTSAGVVITVQNALIGTSGSGQPIASPALTEQAAVKSLA